MKKLWISLITILTSVSMYALPLGNPWEASLMYDGIFCEGLCPEMCDPHLSWCDAWSLRLGLYADFVFDHHMRVDSNESDASIHSTESYTQAAYLVFNMWDRIDLFATLGATNFIISTPRKSFGGFNLPNAYAYIETDTYFSYSLGVRGTIWECGCLGIGAEAQYFFTRPPINYTYDNLDADDNTIAYRHSGDRFKYQEWQIGLGAAYRINIACASTALIPYAGVTLGNTQIDMDEIRDSDGNTFYDLESDRQWGWALGLTLVGCNKMSVTAEARFENEKALYVNAQFRF